jgi:integrase
VKNGAVYVLPGAHPVLSVCRLMEKFEEVRAVEKCRLTDDRIRRQVVPEGHSQSIIWDTVVNRLASRKYRSGRAVAVWMYRPPPGGRGVAERPLTLGTFYSADGAKGIAVEDARTAARAAAGKLALGLDPADDVREARRAAKSRLSVLLDDDGPYQQHLEEREIRNRRSVLATLRRYLSRLMDRDVAAVSRADLVDAIEKSGNRGDTRKHARALWEWCVARGYAPHNPLVGLRMARSPAERLSARRKSRSLKDQEIEVVWAVTNSPDSFHQLTRFCLLTGVRRSEAAALTWGMVKDDRIVLPDWATKMKREHQIPLTPTLRALLDAQPRINDLVFPSPRKRTRVIAWTPRIRALRRVTGIEDFRMHLLRKSVRTVMSRCGVSRTTARLAIGHQHEDQQDQAYDHHDHWEERVRAFETVAAYIERLTNNDTSVATTDVPTKNIPAPPLAA